MRRFAFRAWNSKNKEWEHKEPCNILGEMILLGGWMDKVRLENLNDIIVMQFTGLKDSLNNDIYENDIIRSFDSTGDAVLFLIKYDNEHARFYAMQIPKKKYLSCSGIRQSWIIEFNFEVIGNVYEGFQH